MALDRNAVDRHAGRQIAELQQARRVDDREKRRIRLLHERIARKVERDRRR